MDRLTTRQQEILDFIQAGQTQRGVVPSLREIARQFSFRSMTAAADHVRALRKKGYLLHHPRLARSHGVVPLNPAPNRLAGGIPIMGSIAAGFPRDSKVEAGRTVELGTLGVACGERTFALEVRGDSMIGRHIMDGDTVIVDCDRIPRPGDVVAALIDRESTLKTFELEDGRPVLRAENPNYPDLVPADELLIQGVMVALVRKCG
jgi:repressor LexA